uniref:3',5'-cyclic-GMP phosphodiesterase n=1 Tax=Oryzias latipes TaxID=8090 RepID=A0A3P9H121_ORYLA
TNAPTPPSSVFYTDSATYGHPEGAKPTPSDLQQEERRRFKSKDTSSCPLSVFLAEVEGSDDAAVICPWEEFEDVELSDLAQYGTV